jgi:hypothetical protein
MQLSNDQIILLSELLIKVLKEDIEQKNQMEEIPPSFIEFKDLIKEKKKRGRPLGSYKKCNISSER